ncbi:hypothetical protein [Verrucomicrobium sp. BvORR106]|uniref:hypothetical protein n=1 Tax=Verrucomicrobium sp. BvORR106 TaxID=1403819 RepID=UPI002240F5A9|nr:hypothetical protein [Verrucomicrobium sp. BvORR106]
MKSELKSHLVIALTEAQFEFSRYSDDWSVDRRDLCAMWGYVIATAPDALVTTAVKQVAHYFHPKAEINVPSDLRSEVEILALGLISDELYRSYESFISACILKRVRRRDSGVHREMGQH